MQESDYIWQNGDYKKWEAATVHILTHSLHYGTGAFEGIRFYKTDNGPAVFRLNDHIDRLFYSANAAGMTMDYSVEEICKIIIELIKKNRLEEGYIRPLFYFGYRELSVFATVNPTELAIACWSWPKYIERDYLDIKTSQYIRIHPKSTTHDAKLCGHYINGQLASLEIRNTHYHGVLLLDVNGYVAEGAAANFFIVKNSVLYTPTTDNILPGITRDTIITLAKQNGYEVHECNLMLPDVLEADEAFFVGTAIEVMPIRSLDDKIIGDNKPKPITDFIRRTYRQLVHGNYPEFKTFLTLVSKHTLD